MAWVLVEKIPNGRIEITNDASGVSPCCVVYDPSLTPKISIGYNWLLSTDETWSEIEALLDALIEL